MYCNSLVKNRVDNLFGSLLFKHLHSAICRLAICCSVVRLFGELSVPTSVLVIYCFINFKYVSLTSVSNHWVVTMSHSNQSRRFLIVNNKTIAEQHIKVYKHAVNYCIMVKKACKYLSFTNNCCAKYICMQTCCILTC